MGDDHLHHHEGSPDPLDEFLAQLLSDIPDFLPAPITTQTPQTPPLPSTSAPVPVPVPTSALEPAEHPAPNPDLTCQWISTHDHPLICGEPLPSDPKQACTHFRHAHDVRGNEKVTVNCNWRDCHVPPMQRGSLIRHLLSVHLGLLRWQCEVCGRMFSRKGTGHACADSSEAG